MIGEFVNNLAIKMLLQSGKFTRIMNKNKDNFYTIIYCKKNSVLLEKNKE